jgi:hypothetical protein
MTQARTETGVDPKFLDRQYLILKKFEGQKDTPGTVSRRVVGIVARQA